jgi:AbrB family looped-hinge helix DNA binding protein
MTIAIDSAGRLVIPKAVREAAGITPDTPLEVRFRDGRIEIEPAPVAVRITRQRGVAVATAATEVPPLTSRDVLATRDRVRAERG